MLCLIEEKHSRSELKRRKKYLRLCLHSGGKSVPECVFFFIEQEFKIHSLTYEEVLEKNLKFVSPA